MTENEMFKNTRKVIYDNMVKGSLSDGTRYHYTKPSPGRYPYQFFWDTCFHVYILVALGEHNMAKEHLLSLFRLQRNNGFTGHMIYWKTILPGRITDIFQAKPKWKNFIKSHMSSLIQPPLAAQATARIYETSRDTGFLLEILPKLKKYYRWLGNNRDFNGDGLITIISPFESGMDWKPTYDIALGLKEKKADWKLFLKVIAVDFSNCIHNYNLEKIYRKDKFLVKDVGVNSIYAQNLKALAYLCDQAGDNDANEFRLLASKVAESILNVMYDEKDKAFYDTYGKANTKIRILTPTIFYPLILDEVPEEITTKVLAKHFFDSDEFSTTFPIPSVAMGSASFNADESLYLWRGPTWIINNWFMHRLLLKKKHYKEADRLIKSIISLVGKSGFREYYNPVSGEGYGAHDFTWAGLVTDMICVRRKATIENSKI